jgi:hypothetical protein
MMAKPIKVVNKCILFPIAYSLFLFSQMPFLISLLFTPTTIIIKRANLDNVSIRSVFDL